MVAVAEISQVYEIAFVAGEDGVAELQVAVDGSVLVRSVGYEAAYLVFLGRGEKGILLQKPQIAFFDVFELRGINMYGMQLEAHLGKL